jgi:dUTPase
MYAAEAVTIAPKCLKMVKLGVNFNTPDKMNGLWHPSKENPSYVPEKSPFETDSYWETQYQTEIVNVRNITDEAITIAKHDAVGELEFLDAPLTAINPSVPLDLTIKDIQPGAKVLRKDRTEPWAVTSHNTVTIYGDGETAIPTGVVFHIPPGYKILWKRHPLLHKDFQIVEPDSTDDGATVKIKSNHFRNCIATSIMLAYAYLVPIGQHGDEVDTSTPEIQLKAVVPGVKRPEKQPDGSWLVFSSKDVEMPSLVGDYISTGATFDIPQGEQPEWNIYKIDRALWQGWVLGSEFLKHPDVERFSPSWDDEAQLHVCNIVSILTCIEKDTPLATLSLKKIKRDPNTLDPKENLNIPYIKSVATEAKPPLWQHTGHYLVFSQEETHILPNKTKAILYGASFKVPEGTEGEWLPYPTLSPLTDGPGTLIPMDTSFKNDGMILMTTTDEVKETIQKHQPIALLKFTPNPISTYPELIWSPLDRAY